MSEQQCLIHGEVNFRVGDGVLMPVPQGPVDVAVADDSVTLGWTASDGSAGSAAIPREEFERHVSEGNIRQQGEL